MEPQDLVGHRKIRTLLLQGRFIQLTLLMLFAAVVTGCSESRPPLEDVKTVVERLHRNLLKVEHLQASYKVERSFDITTYTVEYVADVKWLETLKYEPADKPVVRLGGLTLCIRPAVVRRGEP